MIGTRSLNQTCPYPNPFSKNHSLISYSILIIYHYVLLTTWKRKGYVNYVDITVNKWVNLPQQRWVNLSQRRR
jgi:hypothetical protein